MNGAYLTPQDCPRCGRGPFKWPASLRAHAYVWHGYLSLREIADLMGAAERKDNEAT